MSQAAWHNQIATAYIVREYAGTFKARQTSNVLLIAGTIGIRRAMAHSLTGLSDLDSDLDVLVILNLFLNLHRMEILCSFTRAGEYGAIYPDILCTTQYFEVQGLKEIVLCWP